MALGLQTRCGLVLGAASGAILALLAFALLRPGSVLPPALAAPERAEPLPRHAMQLASRVAAELAAPLRRQQGAQVRRLLERARHEPRLRYLQVYDRAGRIVYDAASAPAVLHQPQLARATLRGMRPRLLVDDHEIAVAYPIRLGDERLGGVLIGLAREPAAATPAAPERPALELLLLAATLLAAGALIAYLLAARLIRPIRALAAYAGEIGRGNYDASLPLARRDEIGELARTLDALRERLKRSNEEIRFLAYHDRLTGLPNRALFKERLELGIEHARRAGRALALLLIDVDDFKRINDTFGHALGDQALRTLAARIGGCLREADPVAADGAAGEPALAARLGGDEFIVLLPLADDQLDAALAARRILARVAEPLPLDGQELYVAASVGIAVFPGDGASAAELIRNADIAMHHAKASGKNAYRYFTESMDRHASHDMRIELELRKALERDELAVYYQPQVSLRTGRIVGVEALVRWRHPEHGVVRPDEFIRVAEQTGLIAPIGERVLRTALADLRRWHDAGHDQLFVAVNVSAAQFRRMNLAQAVERALRDAGLAARALQLEVTESSLMTAEEQAAQTLERLRALGVSIWLDDFGTGYSSLSYLRRFAIDGVKIDRSFVRGMAAGEDDRAVASAIIAMARRLALGVVAEGVENRAQEELLRAEGCEVAQGYRYGDALPAAELERALAGARPGATLHVVP